MILKILCRGPAAVSSERWIIPVYDNNRLNLMGSTDTWVGTSNMTNMLIISLKCITMWTEFQSKENNSRTGNEESQYTQIKKLKD